MQLIDMESSTVERQMIRLASERKVPINGSLELTPLCNMNCGMCYVHLDHRSMERQGQLRTSKEWLELGRQMQEAGVLFLLLTGGEPLLYPEFKEVYLGLRQMGMILTINTNGSLIDNEWTDFFIKYPPRRINVTMYGASEKTYERVCSNPDGYEKMVNGIRLLKRAGLAVKAAQTVVRANVCDQESIFAFAKGLNIPCSCDAYVLPAVRERRTPFAYDLRLGPEVAARARWTALCWQMSRDELWDYVNSLLSAVDSFTVSEGQPAVSCLAGSCSFTVNWQGLLRPCVVSSNISVPVFETGFAAAWKELRSRVDELTISSKCSTCRLRSLCSTCLIAALYETGKTNGTPEYLCKMTENFVDLLREFQKDTQSKRAGGKE